MSTHKHIDKICCVVLALTLLLTVFFVNAEQFGVQKASAVMGYEKLLFDTSSVHTVDIIMDDWDEFTENCKSEEYSACTVVIDNEAFKNVAIRGKGNTSLSQVTNGRYSYKIEFDHYDSTNTYHGLDKLCLNNIIQDNTYMKDYLTYQMMNEAGVASPLCSYVYITVNGEEWGLYLAVEGVEEAFLQRNYGKSYGELYKPDSQSLGGGRGNGEKFDSNGFSGELSENVKENAQNGGDNNSFFQAPEKPSGEEFNVDGGFDFTGKNAGGKTSRDNFDFENSAEMPEPAQGDLKNKAGGDMINGSDDVLLKYIDDDPESYSNIFDNAKTDVSNADKARLVNALKNLNSGEELENSVDTEKVISYFAVHNFVLNFDSYTGSMIHNYYLYEKDGQLQMIPWDYNLAFGGFQSTGDATAMVNYPIDSPVFGGTVESRPMLAWIFENEEYTEQYHKCIAEFISEYFDSGRFEEMIDFINTMISPYVEKDPTKFCTYEEFKTGIATLKKFCLLRAESIKCQLSGEIDSTSEVRQSDALVDAGDINISDMGSMSSAGGRQNSKENTAPEDKTRPSDETKTAETDATTQNESAELETVDGSSGLTGESGSEGEKPQSADDGRNSFKKNAAGVVGRRK